MQEFLKILFYGIVIFFIFRKLLFLFHFNDYIEKKRLLKEYMKSIKDNGESFNLKTCPEHIKYNLVYTAVFGTIEIFMCLFGLLTFNWIIFMFILIFANIT